MKVKGFDCKFRFIFLVLVLFFGIILGAEGDIGGGGGVLITPYVPEKEIKEEEVVQVKNMSSRTRLVNTLELKETVIDGPLEYVGLLYVEDQDVEGEPFFQFKGVSESGDEITIDFSEVERFLVLRIKNRWFAKDQAFLEVVRFPDISPKDLLTKRPAYSDLREKYTKRVRLWIPLENNNKNELCLVGKKWPHEDQYQILSKLRDIKEHSEVIFEYGYFRSELTGERIPSIWWAVDSVIQDEQYPHKHYFKE